MRNIKFDESSVLAEYARIANEKGFVRVAEDISIGPSQIEIGGKPEAQEGSVTMGLPTQHKNVRWTLSAENSEQVGSMASFILNSFYSNNKFAFVGDQYPRRGPRLEVVQSDQLILELVKFFANYVKSNVVKKVTPLIKEDQVKAEAFFRAVLVDIGKKLIGLYGKDKLPEESVNTQLVFEGMKAYKMLMSGVQSSDDGQNAEDAFTQVIKTLQSGGAAWGPVVKDLQVIFPQGATPEQIRSYFISKKWKSIPPQIENILKSFPTSSQPTDAKSGTKNILPQVIKTLQSGGAAWGPVVKKLQIAFPQGATPDQIRQYFVDMGWKSIPPQIEGALKSASLYTKNIEKQADGHYDVTKETGEQLIDSAHPGGGTHTELSVKPKDDGCLVETIVEQQRKDIEVARSVPKGTYASLIKLYNQLSKMGYEKYLGSLRKNILRVSAEEDLVVGSLISLANKLDAMGHEKYANKVDEIISSIGKNSD